MTKIHDAVQNVLVTAGFAISAVLTTSASAPLTLALTPAMPYNVPAADAMGPFYWVTRGRRIGIFSTWYVIRVI